ncbi:hypothetical protein ABK040_011302 [Willaertia magna]
MKLDNNSIYYCTQCHEDEDESIATYYCNNCNKHLCEGHLIIHNKKKLNKDHNLTNLLPEQQEEKEVKNQTTSTNNQKPVFIFGQSNNSGFSFGNTSLFTTSTTTTNSNINNNTPLNSKTIFSFGATTSILPNSNNSTIIFEKKHYCKQHKELETDIYCKDCDEEICSKCALFKHKLHEIIDSCDIVKEEEEKKMKQLFKDLKLKKEVLLQRTNNIKLTIKQVNEQANIVRNDINELFIELQQLLNEKKESLTLELNEIVKDKLNILQNEEKLLNEHNNAVNNLCQLKVDNLNKINILQNKIKFEKKVNDLNELNVVNNLEFMSNFKLKNVKQDFINLINNKLDNLDNYKMNTDKLLFKNKEQASNDFNLIKFEEIAKFEGKELENKLKEKLENNKLNKVLNQLEEKKKENVRKEYENKLNEKNKLYSNLQPSLLEANKNIEKLKLKEKSLIEIKQKDIISKEYNGTLKKEELLRKKEEAVFVEELEIEKDENIDSFVSKEWKRFKEMANEISKLLTQVEDKKMMVYQLLHYSFLALQDKNQKFFDQFVNNEEVRKRIKQLLSSIKKFARDLENRFNKKIELDSFDVKLTKGEIDWNKFDYSNKEKESCDIFLIIFPSIEYTIKAVLGGYKHKNMENEVNVNNGHKQEVNIENKIEQVNIEQFIAKEERSLFSKAKKAVNLLDEKNVNRKLTLMIIFGGFKVDIKDRYLKNIQKECGSNKISEEVSKIFDEIQNFKLKLNNDYNAKLDLTGFKVYSKVDSFKFNWDDFRYLEDDQDIKNCNTLVPIIPKIIVSEYTTIKALLVGLVE